MTLQMIDLSKIISVVQIEEIRVCEASCRSLNRPVDIVEGVGAETSIDTDVVKKPEGDGLLLIRTKFNLEIRAGGGDGKLQAEVRGIFELSYQVPVDEKFSSDELKGFGKVNAVFNAWPYWRELVQSSLTRMAMPVLTVPVYRLLSDEPAEDNGQ